MQLNRSAGVLLRYTYGVCLASLLFMFASTLALAANAPFQIEEAGIADLQQAIKDGRTTHHRELPATFEAAGK